MDIQSIYELLKEVRNDQKEHNRDAQETRLEVTAQSATIEAIKEDLQEIKKDVAENKEDLRVHMKRTYQVEVSQEKMFSELERLHTNNVSRIENLQKAYIDIAERLGKLEEPVKAKVWLKKNYLSIVSLGTATGSLITLVTKLIGWW